MKNVKIYFGFVAIVAMLFTSCSKEEEINMNNQEKASLSFATVLNDMVNKSPSLKQAMEDMPNCSDMDPATVEIVLTGPKNVGTAETPFVVNVSPTPGDYDGDGEMEFFTEESSELELTAGTYSLEYFKVYASDGTLLWVAPIAGSPMANFVDNPLPNDIVLTAGTKKYVDVEVVCFDDRMVNEYGYLFFDIETNKAIEFCIFGNYCDENGRHFGAEYSVDFWTYENGAKGEILYEDVTNNVVFEDGEYRQDPLCFALPDTDGDDEYYFEITLLDSDAYGDVDNVIVREGVLTETEVKLLFDGEDNLDYYHFREGETEDCGDDNIPGFDPEDDATVYRSCLYPLNGSGGLGVAYLSLSGTTLTTKVFATGLEAGKQHPQHIHGFGDDSESTCPPSSAADDIEDDGLVSIDEGAPFYGPVILPLKLDDGSFPSNNAIGLINYEQTFELGQGSNPSLSDINPLENRAIVVHGMTVDGEYVATLPVLCGSVSSFE